MQFYQITPEAANFSNPNDHTAKVDPHNRNKTIGGDAYAVVYVSYGTSDCAASGTTKIGVTETGPNNGTKPVSIAGGAIYCVAARYSLDQDILRAEVVAHESGHRFGLGHPQRTIHYLPMTFSYPTDTQPVLALTLDQFTVDFPNQWILPWLTTYGWFDSVLGASVNVFSDGILPGVGALNTNINNNGPIPLSPGIRWPGTGSMNPAIWQERYTNPLNLQPMADGSGAPLVLEFPRGYIMDWTPDYRKLTPGQVFTSWDFDPGDKTKMCVKAVCP